MSAAAFARIEREIDHYPTTAGKFFDNLSGYAELFDRIFGVLQSVTTFGQAISKSQGHTNAADNWSRVNQGFAAGQGALGAVRVIFPLERLATGKMFWEQDKKDKSWIRDPNGYHVLRDFVDIAQDILALAARLLTPIYWLHGCQVIDLGEHAKDIGHAIMALWAVVITLDTLQNMRHMITEDITRESFRKSLVDSFCNIMDLTALGADFASTMTAHPAASITAAAIHFFADGGFILKEMTY